MMFAACRHVNSPSVPTSPLPTHFPRGQLRRTQTPHSWPGQNGLARREGVPVSTVYRWNSDGTGPRRLKIGKHVRYRLVDVEAWETQRLSSEAVNA